MSDRTCTEDGCERQIHARQLCTRHYSRWLKGRNANKPRPECSIEGCRRPSWSRGWCQSHYMRWRKHGDPTAGRKSPIPARPRIGTCSVDGCDRDLSKESTAGWGMCGKHYQRWKKRGTTADPIRERKLCSIDGCDEPSKARTWCRTHYERWRTYGAPDARRRGEIVDGKRICPRCGIDLPLAYFSDPKKNRCKMCMSQRASEYRIAHPEKYPKVEGWPSVCANCGIQYMANGKKRWCCSSACSDKFAPTLKYLRGVKRRALLHDAMVEEFRREDIFERDRWQCGLCGLQINPALKFPDPGSASVDHVIPLSRGGTHEPANAQASHLLCNVRKSNRHEVKAG